MNVREFWKKWQNISEKAVNFQAKVVLFILYWLLIPFFAILVKLFSDPLNIKNKKPQWLTKEIKELNLNQARKQY